MGENKLKKLKETNKRLKEFLNKNYFSNLMVSELHLISESTKTNKKIL